MPGVCAGEQTASRLRRNLSPLIAHPPLRSFTMFLNKPAESVTLVDQAVQSTALAIRLA